MNEKPKIGVIGAGGYAAAHLKAAAQCENDGVGELRAVVILDSIRELFAEKERELREEGTTIYRTHREMLDREKGLLDLVTIPCSIAAHAPLSRDCLAAGFHVLCEKPAAGTLKDALAMRKAKEASGKTLAIGYQDVFSPTIQAIKRTVLEGSFGALLAAKSRVLLPRGAAYYRRNAWAGKLEVEGSAVYDSPIQNAAAHFLNALLYCAGPSPDEAAVPVELYAENYRVKTIESADTQFLRFRTTGGTLVEFMASHAAETVSEPYAEYLFERGKSCGARRTEAPRYSTSRTEPAGRR